MGRIAARRHERRVQIRQCREPRAQPAQEAGHVRLGVHGLPTQRARQVGCVYEGGVVGCGPGFVVRDGVVEGGLPGFVVEDLCSGDV